eukprot:COSAG01_NODE_47027_length_394_cov_1.322034_1_plen_43_part_10
MALLYAFGHSARDPALIDCRGHRLHLWLLGSENTIEQHTLSPC